MLAFFPPKHVLAVLLCPFLLFLLLPSFPLRLNCSTSLFLFFFDIVILILWITTFTAAPRFLRSYIFLFIYCIIWNCPVPFTSFASSCLLYCPCHFGHDHGLAFIQSFSALLAHQRVFVSFTHDCHLPPSFFFFQHFLPIYVFIIPKFFYKSINFSCIIFSPCLWLLPYQ